MCSFMAKKGIGVQCVGRMVMPAQKVINLKTSVSKGAWNLWRQRRGSH